MIHLQFVVDLLKEQVKEIKDPILRLKFAQEIFRYVKEMNSVIDDEIEYLKNARSF